MTFVFSEYGENWLFVLLILVHCFPSLFKFSFQNSLFIVNEKYFMEHIHIVFSRFGVLIQDSVSVCFSQLCKSTERGHNVQVSFDNIEVQI